MSVTMPKREYTNQEIQEMLTQGIDITRAVHWFIVGIALGVIIGLLI